MVKIIKPLNYWLIYLYPDSKGHGANMGPTWVLSAPDGPHVSPWNLAIRDNYIPCKHLPKNWLYAQTSDYDPYCMRLDIFNNSSDHPRMCVLSTLSGNVGKYSQFYTYIYMYVYIYIVTNTTIGWLAKKYNRWGTFLFLIIFLQNLYNYILKSMSLHRLYNFHPNLRNIRYTSFGVTQWSNDLFSCKSSTVRWQSPNGNEIYMTPNGPG